MILSLLLVGTLWAQETPSQAPTEEVERPEDVSGGEDSPPVDPDALSPFRVRFDSLAKRTIGTASKPVAFNWRRTRLHLAASGSLLYELNTFNSARVGGMVRFPSRSVLVELGANYAHSWNSTSSEQLALTPYRQPGRPNRLDIDLNIGIPLAEGVVTTRTKFLPALQMVFSAYAGLRYSVYPAGFPEMKPGEVMRALFDPGLTEKEVGNLEDNRLAAMKVDPARYGLLAGVGNDVYFSQGVFISPRVLVSIPVLAPASGSDLLWWADVSLAVGWAF